MTWMSRFTWFFLAAALSCASAAAFLIYQYRLGIPLSFTTNMWLAVVLGVIVPTVVVMAFAWLRKNASGHARYGVYCGVCLALTGTLAYLAG